MGLDRALPGGKFLGRQLVIAASVLDVHLAAAHGVDNRRLAPRDPALCVGGRQVGWIGANVRQEFASGISTSRLSVIQSPGTGMVSEKSDVPLTPNVMRSPEARLAAGARDHF